MNSSIKDRRTDMIFAIVLVISFVVHNAVIFYLYHVKIPKFESIEEIQRFIPKRFIKIIAPKLVEEQKTPAATTVAQKEETQAQEGTGEEGEKAGPGKTDEEGTGGKGTSIDEAKRREMIRQKVRTKGLLALITSKRKGGGALADILSKGAGFAKDLDEAMRQVAGVKLARSAKELGVARAGGTGGGGVGIGELKATEGGSVGLGGKENVKVASRIRTEGPKITGFLDANSIRQTIMRRMGMIKYCYEKVLKKNPQLHGKVVVKFTINAKGRVTKYSIESSTLNNEEVEGCVLRVIRRLRFPPPKEGGEVTVSYPIVFTVAS